ncbi:hypothetical protein CR513_03141, partial [Mucuna pruriens]
MCDASNLVLGVVLGQRVRTGKPAHVIAYASRIMDPAQTNYTTTEKELLTIEFNLEIRDKKGADNTVVDHLSRIKGKVDPVPIRDNFPNEKLLLIAQGVFRILRSSRSSIFAILHLEAATMDPPRRPEKYLNVDSIGLLFFKMHTNLSRLANSVKKLEWP